MRKRITATLIVALIVVALSTLIFSVIIFNRVDTEDEVHELNVLAGELSEWDLSPANVYHLAEYNVIPKESAEIDLKEYLYTEFVDSSGDAFFIAMEKITFLSTLSKMIGPTLIFLVVMAIFIFFLSTFLSDGIMRTIKGITKYIHLLLTEETIDDAVYENYMDLAPFIKDIAIEKNRLDYSINTMKHTEKLRQEFTANVTHELKTPLTSINGYAEMIASGMTSPEYSQKFAQIILDEGNRLLALINETIQLSQYDGGHVDKSDREPLDLYELVNDTFLSLKAYAAERRVKLLLKGTSTEMVADRRMMMDLITNLVGNAIKYNNPGGYVEVTTKYEGNRILLIFKDNGIGIARENFDRIFERFFVVDKSRSRSSGTGLGLSLVKHIVKIHDGEIFLSSVPQKGSTFTVTFPRDGETNEEPPSEDVSFL